MFLYVSRGTVVGRRIKPKVGGLNYSFSGLKTAFLRFIEKESKINKVKERVNK